MPTTKSPIMVETCKAVLVHFMSHLNDDHEHDEDFDSFSQEMPRAQKPTVLVCFLLACSGSVCLLALDSFQTKKLTQVLSSSC